LARLLARAAVRLLTISGPGGMGKTRLALAAAAQAAQRFAAGAAFVPLQAVAVIERVPTAIAEALALPLAGTADPFNQVAGFLHDRQQLLVLDNLEHLPAAGALISRLLAATPGFTMLATSREALHLQEEWRFPLAGLALPAEFEQTDAVQLFVERARRARYDLELETEYAAIVQICRLVGGMPLAIELAAAWTRTLSCAAIAAALAQSLDLLSSNLRNIPERHRSLRAVCDQAWALLGPGEQQAFQQLARFEAGFSAPAAQAVAGADLSLRDALISRSLVRRSDGDRYQIHALLRYSGGHNHCAPVGRAASRIST
jgi:predicted ATPase